MEGEISRPYQPFAHRTFRQDSASDIRSRRRRNSIYRCAILAEEGVLEAFFCFLDFSRPATIDRQLLFIGHSLCCAGLDKAKNVPIHRPLHSEPLVGCAGSSGPNVARFDNGRETTPPCCCWRTVTTETIRMHLAPRGYSCELSRQMNGLIRLLIELFKLFPECSRRDI